jgi:hypothetical protein
MSISYPGSAGFKFVSAILGGILVVVCVGRTLTNETRISRKPLKGDRRQQQKQQTNQTRI